MKKRISHIMLATFSACFMAIGVAQAQDISLEVVSSPSFQGVDVSEDYFNFTVYIEVTNEGSEVLDLRWMMDPSDDCTAEWGWVACDNLLCYPEDVMSNILWVVDEKAGTEGWEGYSYTLDPGESHEYSIKVYPHGTAGCCSNTIRFATEDNPENFFDSIEVFVGVNNTDCLAVGIDEVVDATPTLYPNPTTSVLNITSSSLVNHVMVYDLLGNLMIEKRSDQIMNVDLSDLGAGAYIVAAGNGMQSDMHFQRVVKK
jgi:hypothetical protein